MQTEIFTFLNSPAGQIFLTAALQAGGTIVNDLATIFKSHAAAVAAK